MKRHPGLVPLSHDHHHALSQARRLRRAAGSAPAARLDAAAGFIDFFDRETAAHFREEEDVLFPLFALHADEPPPELAEVLVQHARLRALVGRLRGEAASGEVGTETLAEIGVLLDEHVRLEERRLFPLLEEAIPDEELAALPLPPWTAEPEAEGSPVVRLAAGGGSGPVWGTASEDLNATLLAWPPGSGTPEQVNEERDVLLVVLAGSGTLELDGEGHAVAAGHAVLVAKGRRFRVVAGPGGLRYLSVHLRRPRLQIASRA